MVGGGGAIHYARCLRLTQTRFINGHWFDILRTSHQQVSPRTSLVDGRGGSTRDLSALPAHISLDWRTKQCRVDAVLDQFRPDLQQLRTEFLLAQQHGVFVLDLEMLRD